MIETVTCPECGQSVRVGVPDDATVVQVAAAAGCDADRTYRQTVCERGHTVHFTF